MMGETSQQQSENRIDPWLAEHLACPVDGTALEVHTHSLRCRAEHSFPIVEGVPILLHPRVRPEVTVPQSDAMALEILYAEAETAASDKAIDPYVQQAVAATNGIMYRSLIDRLTEYPIPSLDWLPQGEGAPWLDIGCNWGRWSLAAQRRGYRAVGIDPNAEAIFAARRVARQQGSSARFVVGDARYLPFRTGTFEHVYSYSVLQHFDKNDTRRVLKEIARVLETDGRAVIQMANALGPRSVYHQARRGFGHPSRFDVRYWTPRELTRAWEEAIGPTSLSVDGYFTLNPQPAERHLLALHYRWVVSVSRALKAIAGWIPPLKQVADSVYLTSHKKQAADQL